MAENTRRFRPASPEDFAAKYRQFGPLVHGKAADVWKLLNTEESFQKMRWATLDMCLPAVAGVAKSCAPAIRNAQPGERDHLKKGIGAMVCAIMEANGFHKTGRKKAVPPVPDKVFRTGEVYEPGPDSGGDSVQVTDEESVRPDEQQESASDDLGEQNQGPRQAPPLR